MPEFCDVAVPAPLEMVFTYRVGETAPVVGGRVLVPFRAARLSGIVTKLHDVAPSMNAKSVIAAIDAMPVLDSALLKLGEWIAQYYLAPIGQVFATMLPLMAEIKRAWSYYITEAGQTALYDSATVGSSRRSKQSVDEQMLEYEVLNYLAGCDADSPAREQTLRSATGATRDILSGLLRKKWIAREDISQIRDATRTIKVAVLRAAPALQADDGGRKLNDNQQTILLALQHGGGRSTVESLKGLNVPRGT